ncbi:MAG: hypothetical protein CM1200mP2_32080 [Planctomycetaceae bacterium]|nr:MAG: hypothetical protein CM1200mP2_32080 [Planctomycetaceae bacterium]
MTVPSRHRRTADRRQADHRQRRDIGKAINPLELPNVLAKLSGQDVKIEVLRPQPTGEPETIALTVPPTTSPAGSIRRNSRVPPGNSLAGPRLRLHRQHPGGHTRQPGRESGDPVRRPDQPGHNHLKQLPTETEPTKFDITFDDQNANWAHAIWMIQRSDESKPVLLHVVGADGKERESGSRPGAIPTETGTCPNEEPVTTPQRDPPGPGIGDAMGLAVNHAETTLARIWLTLGSLFTGDISVTELHGPIGIARAAYSVAETSSQAADLSRFPQPQPRGDQLPADPRPGWRPHGVSRPGRPSHGENPVNGA